MKPVDHSFNNPIIRHKYTSDPTVLVHHSKVYLYTGHDEAPAGSEEYVMNDWCCFSSADLVNWQEHAVPLSPKHFSWAKGDAYASKVIYRNGQFYWYVATSHATITGKAIGVAVASKPAGPFADARGTALITQEMIPAPTHDKVNLDPTVLIDTDGQAYIFWGNRQCYYTKLKENMIELDSAIIPVDIPGFAEGAHLHQRNGWYYLCYGYGSPEKVAYSMSQSIAGPWEFKGLLNELAGNCETNRPAILALHGQSYFFYHNGALKDGGSHRRSVCIDYLYYNDDDTIQRVIMSSEGVAKTIIRE